MSARNNLRAQLEPLYNTGIQYKGEIDFLSAKKLLIETEEEAKAAALAAVISSGNALLSKYMERKNALQEALTRYPQLRNETEYKQILRNLRYAQETWIPWVRNVMLVDERLAGAKAEYENKVKEIESSTGPYKAGTDELIRILTGEIDP